MSLTASALTEALTPWLHQHFPGDPAPVVLAASPITGGWETEIWSVTVRRGSAAEGLVLRLYTAGALPKAEHEYLVMQGLAAAGYPVPQVHALEADPAWLGGPFLVMERIDGPLLAAPPAAAAHPSSPANIPHAALDVLVRLMVDLHRLPPNTVPHLKQRDPQTLAQDLMAEAFETVAAFGLSDRFRPLLHWLETRCRQITPPPHLSLIHYDLHPMNILLRGGTEPVVIDWSGCEVADPRTDLAWTMVLFGSVLDASAPAQIQARYEATSGEVLRDMDFFEAFALTRRLFFLVVSLTAGSERLGMRPETAEVIRQNPQQVRYLVERLRTLTGVSLPDMA